MKWLKLVYLKQLWRARKHDEAQEMLKTLRFLTVVCVVDLIGLLISSDLFRLIVRTPGETFWRIFTIVAMCWCAFWTASSAVLLVMTLLGLPDFLMEKAALEVPIPADHGNTIAEVIWKLKNEPVEYLVTFDEDGTKLEETTRLHPTTVSPTQGCRMHLRNYSADYHIQVHNHPSSSSAFSENDIAVMINDRLYQSIVIAKHMVYTMTIPEEAWDELNGESLKEEYNRLYEESNYYSVFGNVGISDQLLRTVHICQFLADKYGFEFKGELYRNSEYYRQYRREHNVIPFWQKLLGYRAGEATACAEPTTERKFRLVFPGLLEITIRKTK